MIEDGDRLKQGGHIHMNEIQFMPLHIGKLVSKCRKNRNVDRVTERKDRKMEKEACIYGKENERA